MLSRREIMRAQLPLSEAATALQKFVHITFICSGVVTIKQTFENMKKRETIESFTSSPSFKVMRCWEQDTNCRGHLCCKTSSLLLGSSSLWITDSPQCTKAIAITRSSSSSVAVASGCWSIGEDDDDEDAPLHWSHGASRLASPPTTPPAFKQLNYIPDITHCLLNVPWMGLV